MSVIIFDFPNPSPMGKEIREIMNVEEGKVVIQDFPDRETYLRIESDVRNRNVILNASLFHPNDWILSLIFLADALRAQGSKRIILLAPYLPYMRQDKVFQRGEALSSVTFANLLSTYFTDLITVDPHLHRYHSLGDIYSIPTTVVKAAPLISEWIHTHVENPFLIGPDAESKQWVKEIAGELPYIVLEKVRYPDGHVSLSWPKAENIGKRTPVFVDDIISSGETILQALPYLKRQGSLPPLCIAIHSIFAGNSYQKLQDEGIKKIITCNTIPHPSNQINLDFLIAQSLKTIVS